MSETNFPTPPAPQPAHAGPAAPLMSTPETLTGIFFEPSRTFEALRERPRFLVAGLIGIIAFMTFYVLYIERVGYDNLIDAETSVARKTRSNVTEEQLQQGAEIQKKPFVKIIRTWSPIIVFLIIYAAGAALYLLGANLMGGSMNYKKALSVWAYSSMPPLLILLILNLILLFVSPPDDDATIVQGLGRGLVRANPGAFFDATAHPVLVATLGSLDLIAFFGLFLAALGLRKVGRVSSGGAWTVVLVLWGIGVLVRIVTALAFGRA